MGEPKIVGDGEEIRFTRDVELLRTGKPIPEVTDASYHADLAMADLLMRARFAPTAEFRAHLQNKLQSQLEAERSDSMVLILGLLLRRLFKGAVVVGLTASLVLATVLVVSPEARAQAQGLIGRFVEADSPWAFLSVPSAAETAPESSSAETPRRALPTPDPAPSFSAGVEAILPTPPGMSAPPQPQSRAARPGPTLVSLEEAQAQTSFTIKVPARLPEGYSLKGVEKPPSLPKIEGAPARDGAVPRLPSAVNLIFENGAGEMLILSETSLPVPPAGEVPLSVGEGSVQEVSVNGQPGQYVEGAWSPQGWDASARHHQLQWQGADGVNYGLLSQTLGLDELLATAESVP
jgi:hypothetical protein